jgi:hypothetical protein
MNVETGEIRAWDSLSDAEKASGKWIKLPPHDMDGHCMARRKAPFEDIAPALTARENERYAALSRIAGAPGSERRGSFDALGRPKW